MKAAYVKCLYCGQQFNRNDPSIQVKQVTNRRYAHLICWEAHVNNLSQEEKDIIAFYDYTKQLFGENYNYILTKKLAERFVKENNYTYTGMLKTLKWYYEKEKHTLDKSNGSIGIIPYVYNQAMQWYYSLYQAQQANNGKDVEIFIKPKEKIIKMPRLWLEEDDET